jgi:uncharacterized protein (TIGR03435 family)
MRTIVTASLIVCTSIHAFSQSAPAKPAFEVASIKPNVSGSGHAGTHISGGEVIMRNVPLRNCIEMAYHVDDARLSGPDWLASERFDIVAKPPVGAPRDQYRQMLQTLLADRFKLIAHRESKMLPAIALVVGKNGPKLRKGDPGGPHFDVDNTTLTAGGASMAQFADHLSDMVDRPVVDKTGLEGVFDFRLEWLPDEYQSSTASEAGEQRSRNEMRTGPAFFRALQEQIGLRLESQKLPIEIVVVDRIEKVPSEN